MSLLDTNTIAAIATPLGRGGIGIVKLSGPQAISIADKIFRFNKSHQLSKISLGASPAHKLNFGTIVSPENGRVIDEVLISIMPAPHSYTREDVVEINAHSGIFVLKEIFNLVVQYGAVPAEPGEFTKRAFLNGRIDLVQAEAVVDLINARSGHAADLATRQLNSGSCSVRLSQIRESILRILAFIEAAIDFPGEMEEELALHDIQHDVKKSVIQPLKELISGYEQNRYYRDGLKVAIVGRPNVGKSSLLNRLLESDRAIVTDIPGTTRDLIDADLYIKGVPVIITDTAGLRETSNEIEAQGIRKTRERIRDADIVLFVIALDEGLTAQDQTIFREIKSCNVIMVFNKADCVDEESIKKIQAGWGSDLSGIAVSALKDRSFTHLRELIIQQFTQTDGPDLGSGFVPNLRQKCTLEKCLLAMEKYLELVGLNEPAEIIALEVRLALGALDELSGSIFNDDLLDSIFKRFCIGK